MYERLLALTARTVPDAGWRAEVVEVALRSSAADGVAGRARELAGIVWCGLRLRSHAAAGSSPARTWRQGAGLGGTLVLAAAYAEQVAAPGAAAWPGPALGLALAAALSGRRLVAVVVGAGVLVVVSGAAGGGTWSPVVSGAVVAVLVPAPHHQNEAIAGPIMGTTLTIAAIVAFVGLLRRRPWASRLAAVTAVATIAGFALFHALPVETAVTEPYWGDGTTNAAQVGSLALIAVTAAGLAALACARPSAG